MPTTPEHAYVVGWLRRFGAAAGWGVFGKLVALPNGRAQVAWTFPSAHSARLAMEFVDTLVAMAREDEGAAAEPDDLLIRIVRDYHDGDDGGE